MHLTNSLIFLVSLTLTGIHAELIAVIQIFRHGQRTANEFYPNDPYRDPSYWGGLAGGQLTNEGKRQHFKLGQFTRSRYSNFLPQQYDPKIFYAQSTDVDRTHMSAQSNIYGMFPASTAQQWRNRVDWQPIPVHPANTSIVPFTFYPRDCAAYMTELTNVLNSEEYQNYESENSAVFNYLTKNSGANISGIMSVNEVWDPLKVEDSVGLSLPAWTKSVYPEPLKSMNGKFFETFTHTTKMKRLVVGPFLNEVVEHLESMAKDPTSSYRYKMYSAHDTNIASTLNAFGLFSPSYPPAFRSSIYIELHLENWKSIVKVFHKDSDEIKQVSVNGCELDCPLTSFRDALSTMIVDLATRNQECDSTVQSKFLLGSSPITGKYSAEDIKSKFDDVIT